VVERDVSPVGAYRMPGAGRDGIVRRSGVGLERLVHLGDLPAVVRAWPVAGAVRLQAEAATREAALHAVDRMRFALALDHDLGPFHRRFKRDPLVGPVIRRRPWLRPHRVAEPFEALLWAITEQLIDTERAWGIQRRIVWRYGRLSACGRLRSAPAARRMAGRAPAELEACDLSARRAHAMIRAAREVSAGRVDLGEHEPAWARLRRISHIGAWTLEKLAVHGQGRDDQLPAGDLAYLKLVGQLGRLGRRASEEEVRGFFAPYAPYGALAGLYALGAPAAAAPAPRPLAGGYGRRFRAPRPAAARW
jgi:3-methyladenine DNA glycosylase/8-oxoguanine DNA glycosylase